MNDWVFSKSGVRWDEMNQLSLITLDPSLSPSDGARLRRYRDLWNHYEGFHWEDIPMEDKPQVTLNYCRRFVDKFTSFLFGLHDQEYTGFTIKVPTEMEHITLPFLNSVWDAEYNGRRRIASMLGQSGGVTGDAYLYIRYEEPISAENPDGYYDPFEEYPNGRIRIMVLPSHIVFPIYNPSDRDDMIRCVIKYPVVRRDENFIQKATRTIFGRHTSVSRYVIYRQEWTKETWEEWEGDNLINQGPNPYGVIPIVHIRNIDLLVSHFGVSDIEDVIPLNKEINLKMSDNSEIIDYHSAPVTLVYGAKVNQLERGANKIWGNLPPNARVENLQLQGDLQASVNHIASLKEAMFEIGGIPVSALGGSRPISNTSGVALQIEYMPLLEKIGLKRISYGSGLRKACRIILLMGVRHGLIQVPTSVQGRGTSNSLGNDVPEDVVASASSEDSNTSGTNTEITDRTVIRRMFFDVSIKFHDSLPKDEILELEKIQLEMSMKIENREGAMKRLGRENVQQKLAEIDRAAQEEAEREAARVARIMSAHPELSGNVVEPKPRIKSRVVSGFNNGPTPKSPIRLESREDPAV